MLPLVASAGLLAACSGEQGPAKPDETEMPTESAKTSRPVTSEIGTPLAQRVATIGILNKRNNLTQDVTLKPGEAKRVGNVIVKLASCERTAPWESPPETGAFVQVLVRQRASVDAPLRWHKVFSGWLFKNSPSLNVVEHPIYDVWVKDCAMSFPGEQAPAASRQVPSAATNTEAKPSGSEDQGAPR